MSFLDRLLGRTTRRTSREVAKERLQFVLVYDRAQISPALMDILKDEIISSISKHVEIDQTAVEVSLTYDGRQSRLVADIPIVRTHQPRPKRRRASRKKQRVKE